MQCPDASLACPRRGLSPGSESVGSESSSHAQFVQCKGNGRKRLVVVLATQEVGAILGRGTAHIVCVVGCQHLPVQGWVSLEHFNAHMLLHEAVQENREGGEADVVESQIRSIIQSLQGGDTS